MYKLLIPVPSTVFALKMHPLVHSFTSPFVRFFASIHYAPYGAGRSMLRPYRPRLPAPDHVPFLIISHALVARTAVRVGPPCLPDIPFQPNGFRTDAT